MNSECEIFRQQAAQQILGDLSPEHQARLNEHLANCSSCSEEQQQYSTTLQVLRSVQDQDVPRHFFVSQEDRPTPWALFRQLSRTWQLATASATLGLLLLSGAAVARLQVGMSGGMLYAGFGPLPAIQTAPPEPSLDVAQLEARILQAAARRSQEEDLNWVRNLRQEWDHALQGVSAEQRQLLSAALTHLEDRIGARITLTADGLREETASAQHQLYRTLLYQREQDLSLVNERVNRLAAASEARTNQTDAILETLIQVADLSLGANPGGQK